MYTNELVPQVQVLPAKVSLTENLIFIRTIRNFSWTLLRSLCYIKFLGAVSETSE